MGICYKTPQNTRLSANRVWGKWLNCNNFTFVNCSNVRKSWEICTLNIISTFVKCSNDTFYWNLRWREKVMNNHVYKSYTWWYKHSNIMSTLSMLGFQRFLFLFFRRDLEFLIFFACKGHTWNKQIKRLILKLYHVLKSEISGQTP